MNPIVKVKKLAHFNGELPKYQTKHAAGCDICAALSEPLVLKPGQRALVPSGLIFEIPEGYEIQVRPRSGLAFKNGISLVNTPGTIDSDYRGELKVLLINHGQEDFIINNKDRIAQLIISPVVQASFELSSELSETTRGIGGFGSTGVSV
ncbi:MAG: dUTP diphosphatase [Oligoflexia bacterium]|nr:dUTP diphosphatase [Oligoflexia bacterium]